MRLTSKNGNYCDDCGGHCDDYCRCDPEIALYEKLKQYEDTEEQGLLVRLPCKVGDTVWWVPNLNDRTIILKDIVYGFNFDNDGLRLILPDLDIEPLANHNHLFFTREAAKVALKGETKDG